MLKLFALIHLFQNAISTTDVCCRLYEIRGEIGSVNITATCGGPRPFCDHHDMCSGMQVDGEPPLTCERAFELLTRHYERPPLEIPPILASTARFRREVSRDFINSLNDTDHFRDDHFFGQMRTVFQRVLLNAQGVVARITDRNTRMFPRILYNDEIDGTFYRRLKNITDRIKSSIDFSGPESAQIVIKYIHRSFWMREWSFQISSMVRYVAQQSLQDMELVMASMAPTMHAYLYLSSVLEIDYEISIDWYWLIPLLSKYHPLYIQDPADLVWLVPTIPGNVVPVEIQVGPDIDWAHFQDLVWEPYMTGDPDAFSRDLRNPDILARSALASIRRLVAVTGEEESEDTDNQFDELIQVLHRFAYTLRYLGNETGIDLVGVNSETLEAVNRVISAGTPSGFEIDHFTLTTMLRLSRSQLTLATLWTLVIPHTIKMRACDGFKEVNITYLPSGGPNISEFVNGILSIDPYHLSQQEPFRWSIHALSYSQLPSDVHSDLLAMFFCSPVFTRTSFNGDDIYAINAHPRNFKEIHIALGRLIGVYLRSPSLRLLLIPYWTRSHPTSLFETIFFGSHYVRRGVYHVVPYGILEDMFPNAQALVSSLSSLARFIHL